MLIGRRFFFVRAFPARYIPNLKTTASTDESDFAFQSDLAAKLFWQNQATLFVGETVLGAGMQLAQKDTALARGHIGIILGGGAHTGEFLGRHNEKELILGIGEKNEFVGPFSPPA